MECVSNATAFVLVNKSPTYEFPLERGLRQDDPLFPFLFLLAAEGLNVMLNSPIAISRFTRYNDGNTTSIAISHLKFVNDTLLLAKNSWANVRIIKAVLILFEVILGLKVNFSRSMFEGSICRNHE